MEGQSLRVLVVEPQFAPQRARALAGSLGLEVVIFDFDFVDLQYTVNVLAFHFNVQAVSGEVGDGVSQRRRLVDRRVAECQGFCTVPAG